MDQNASAIVDREEPLVAEAYAVARNGRRVRIPWCPYTMNHLVELSYAGSDIIDRLYGREDKRTGTVTDPSIISQIIALFEEGKIHDLKPESAEYKRILKVLRNCRKIEVIVYREAIREWE